MANVTPSNRPQAPDAEFALAISVGMNLAAELVNTVGPRDALHTLRATAGENFTPDELAILTEAFQRVIDGRQSAPDDLSALGHVELAPCPDAACGICGGAR